MASFVEQATLKIVDQSTRQIKTVNGALQQLFRTARQGRAIPIRLNLGQAQSQIKALTRDLDRLRSAQGRGRARQVIVAPTSSQVSRIDAAATAMQRYATAARRAAGVRFPTPPIARGFGAGAMVPGSALGPRVPQHSAFPSRVGIDINPLQMMLNGFVYRLGFTIENAIIRGFGKGVSDLDVATTRLALQDASSEERAAAARVAAETSRNFPLFSRGQALGLAGELLPVVRGEVGALDEVTTWLARMATLRVALGETSEQAIEGSINLAKAGEQMGAFTDAAGNVDTAKVDQFFSTILQGFAQIGREATPELLRALTKSLRASRFSLDERGLLTALFFAEEAGSTAGVGINQLIKQLSGERVQKRQRARQEELGFVQTREIVTGRTGNQVNTEIVVEGTVDEGLLRENPALWVQRYVIPAMRKLGLDPENAVDASRFAGQITSDRTATEALVGLILRAEELNKNVDRALATNVSPERLDRIINESLLVQTREAQQQLIGVLGEIGNSFRDILIPALNTVGSVASTVGAFIAGPEGEGSARRSAAVVAGVAGAGFLTAKAGTSIFNRLFNPLNQSAIALNGSAAALTRAAVALGGAGVATPGGGKSAAGARGGFGRRGVGVSGGLAGLQIIAATADVEVETLSSNPAIREQQLKDAERRREDTAAALNEWAKNLPIIGSLWNKVEEGRAFLNRAWPAGQALSGVEPITADQVAGLREELSIITKGIQRREAARDEGRLGPIGAEQLGVLQGRADTITQQLAMFDKANTMLSTLFDTGATVLGVADAAFSATFSTGSEKLNSVGPVIDTAAAAFGPVAGQGLLAIAPQVGNAIGAAAAAAINNNARVAVNTPPASVNTGVLNPTE